MIGLIKQACSKSWILRETVTDTKPLDMLICNYVYEKPSAHKHKAINYHSAIPCNKFISWKDVKHFKMSQNLLMHSIIYKTKLLKECNLKLPEHTFYVDNLYAYIPLPYVKNMFYLDVDLYRYFIGREDQSVNEAIMIKRIDQQLKVTKLMIDAHDLSSIKNKITGIPYKISCYDDDCKFCTLVKEGTSESLEKEKTFGHTSKVKIRDCTGLYQIESLDVHYN